VNRRAIDYTGPGPPPQRGTRKSIHERRRRFAAFASATRNALAAFIDGRRPQLMGPLSSGSWERGCARKGRAGRPCFQETSAEALRALPTAELGDRDPFSWLLPGSRSTRIIDLHRPLLRRSKAGWRGREGCRLASPGHGDSPSAGLINLLVCQH